MLWVSNSAFESPILSVPISLSFLNTLELQIHIAVLMSIEGEFIWTHVMHLASNIQVFNSVNCKHKFQNIFVFATRAISSSQNHRNKSHVVNSIEGKAMKICGSLFEIQSHAFLKL